MHKTIPFLAILLLCGGCKKYDSEFEEILRLEDRRAGAGHFSRLVMHPNDEVKSRVALALGRSQDPDAVPMLVELLNASNAAVRVEAAFSLGQLAQPYTAKVLTRHLEVDRDLEVRLTLIEALSKVADDSCLAQVDSVICRELADEIPIVRAEAALAAARLAHRGFKQKPWSGKLVALLDDDGEEARWRAAYALMRLADTATAPALQKALHDRSARVRMQAARALGVLADHSASEALTQVAHSDSDWRVRVNAATALGNVVLPQGDRLPLASFPVRDNDQHVRLAALRAIGNTAERLRRENVNFATDTVSAFLLERLNRTEGNGEAHRNWHEQMSAAYALAQLLGREAIAPLASFCESPKARIRAEIARALGATAAPEAFVCLQKLAEDQDLLVRIAALESLPKVSAQKNALPIYLSALNSGDAVLVAIAAQNLAADSSERKNHAPAIIAGYGKLQPPVDIEAGEIIFTALADCGNQLAVPLLEAALSIPDKPFARAAAVALQKLTSRDFSDHLPKETKPHDTFTYAEVKKLKGAWATVETDAGTFELSFFTEEAPLVVLNFVRLAQRGFFDGLLIHRVVPNFVIQTGDPRGDMWGSPGYSIRSEFSRLRFGRGMVGMASVGPDTEGSQWFITHSEQPHLDGRYSLFARVRTGMEVVDVLQVGHRLQRVTIHF